MYFYILAASIVLFLSIFFHKVTGKIGVPTLLAFIVIGMLFGSDGIVKIPFDNMQVAEHICSCAFIFIMFYGGFGTKWSTAKPVAGRALLLSSVGVLITASFVGSFCHFLLHIPFLESMLIGAVVSSTDAASVFSILRSRKLNLKYNTASLIELESGSNDPCAYMLTIIIISLMNSSSSAKDFVFLIFSQLFFGILFGVAFAFLGFLILSRIKLTADLEAIFVLAIALAAYAAPSLLHGNGYLGAYLAGIILGNLQIPNKTPLVHFFDGISDLMEILVFFLLGLLAFPSKLSSIAPMAFAIAIFLTFIARPLTVYLLLRPFKSPRKQILLVSWCGLRGAASIVFTTIALLEVQNIKNDIFHIVFFIVLFSILIQGTLLPLLAEKLDMIDEKSDVLKTFTDYSDEIPVQFLQLSLNKEHPWTGNEIRKISFLPDTLIVLIQRNGENIVPNGNTTLLAGDTIIISALSPATPNCVNLMEKILEKNDDWIEKSISEIPLEINKLIILIKRKGGLIIPNGQTILQENDILVIHQL